MNTNSIRIKTIHYGIKQLIILLFVSFFSIFCSINQVYANNSDFTLQTNKLKEYSNNSIYFYRPCENRNKNFSSTCGNTAREKYWSALIAAGFKDYQVAAMFGSIDHEGGFGPTLYQWKNIVDKDTKQFVQGVTWDTLYNCPKGKCPGGVGSFQITYELGWYLQQIDKENADLIKYFKDPLNYQLPGDEMLKKIGATDFDRLVEQEIKHFVLGSRKASSDGLKATQTLKEATDYWTKIVENCANCCGEADKDKSCEQIEPRRASAKKELDDMSTFTCNGSSSSSGAGGGTYAGAQYNITDEDTLKRLWWAARAEQGIANAKNELSFFVNRFENKGGTPGDVQGLINSIHNNGPGGKEYADTTVEAYDTGVVHWPNGETETFDNPSVEQIAIVKDIIVNGNRTMPPQVVEHDTLNSINIEYVSNDGVKFSLTDRSQFKANVTRIKNKFNAPEYVFYAWANGEQVCSSNDCGDPFGYFPENPPSNTTTNNTSSGDCNNTTTNTIGDGDILSAVEEIIQLANQNGSTYTWGGGHNDDPNESNAMLNGSPINVDCTGFASLVMYKVYGETTSFCSSSIADHPNYEEIPRNSVQPGDIFAYTSPSGHGGIVIEVNNGVVTKIAETGGREGRSGNNTNIGYSGSDDFSVRNMNGENGHFYRYKGK